MYHSHTLSPLPQLQRRRKSMGMYTRRYGREDAWNTSTETVQRYDCFDDARCASERASRGWLWPSCIASRHRRTHTENADIHKVQSRICSVAVRSELHVCPDLVTFVPRSCGFPLAAIWQVQVPRATGTCAGVAVFRIAVSTRHKHDV
jgi:hypothetical protein